MKGAFIWYACKEAADKIYSTPGILGTTVLRYCFR